MSNFEFVAVVHTTTESSAALAIGVQGLHAISPDTSAYSPSVPHCTEIAVLPSCKCVARQVSKPATALSYERIGIATPAKLNPCRKSGLLLVHVISTQP